MSERKMAEALLNVVNFDNWKYPWLSDVTKLVLEYLTLDGLQDALRASDIPDEIMEIVEKELGDCYVVQEDRDGLWCDLDTDDTYEKALEHLEYYLYEARKHKVSSPEKIYRVVKRQDIVIEEE